MNKKIDREAERLQRLHELEEYVREVVSIIKRLKEDFSVSLPNFDVLTPALVLGLLTEVRKIRLGIEATELVDKLSEELQREN